MRHLKSGSKLGKQPAHRRAVLRNLVTNLIEKERIHTTILRAKATRRIRSSSWNWRAPERFASPRRMRFSMKWAECSAEV